MLHTMMCNAHIYKQSHTAFLSLDSVSGCKVQITTGARALSTLHRSILAEYNAIASGLIATELPLDLAKENRTTESIFHSLNTFKESELNQFQLLSGSLSLL